MQINTTRIFEQNAEAWLNRKIGKRRTLNEGGTSSSKTYSILQLLTLISNQSKLPLLTSIVSESMPHLKRGCIRDFINILGNSFDQSAWNKSDFIYTFPNRSQIEFFSADQPAKLRGGRRKILFINEANNISWESFQELDIRTELFTFLDWNPVGEFWAHEQGLISDPASTYIHSTFMDALNVLPEAVIKNILSKKNKDPNWWNVYGLGLLGKVEGLVYPVFYQEDELPKRDAGYGLDFGFSGDPAVLTKNILLPGELHTQELFYETNLTNHDICVRMAELGIRKHYDEIWADSAEPKSIQEIAQEGYNIKPATKGPGSVEYGHQRVRQFKQFWTKDSLNCIKEMRNCRYIKDKDGKFTNKITHLWSHGMDSRRYYVVGTLEPQEIVNTEIYDELAQVERELGM